MSRAPSDTAAVHRARERYAGETDDGPTLDSPPEEVVDLLTDEYAREVLRAVTGEAKPACELVESLGVSRPTVYRRLDDLEEAGLVEPTMSFDPDGHHRQVFQATFEEVTVTLTPDGFGVEPGAPATNAD
ncbi:ArsR/SmtB family transcription factor [Halobaculum sp. MBLA0147]|uniref:ArsR/SmtB family transcription factor n=1 Tax=Halobaculum sp. MBLA0147 TaxID=3079934 RepID=UPI003526B6D0